MIALETMPSLKAESAPGYMIRSDATASPDNTSQASSEEEVRSPLNLCNSHDSDIGEGNDEDHRVWTYEEQFRQLYEIDDNVNRRKFLDDLFQFMQKRSTPVNRIPIMAKQTLDLFLLYELVVSKGGLVEVINRKLWREITKGLNLPHSITSAAFTLRTQYMKYLYPYECEKLNLSTPAELQAAIEGNRRDSRNVHSPNQPSDFPGRPPFYPPFEGGNKLPFPSAVMQPHIFSTINPSSFYPKEQNLLPTDSVKSSPKEESALHSSDSRREALQVSPEFSTQASFRAASKIPPLTHSNMFPFSSFHNLFPGSNGLPPISVGNSDMSQLASRIAAAQSQQAAVQAAYLEQQQQAIEAYRKRMMQQKQETSPITTEHQDEKLSSPATSSSSEVSMLSPNCSQAQTSKASKLKRKADDSPTILDQFGVKVLSSNKDEICLSIEINGTTYEGNLTVKKSRTSENLLSDLSLDSSKSSLPGLPQVNSSLNIPNYSMFVNRFIPMEHSAGLLNSYKL